MSTIENRQKIIQEETIQNGFENIVDGVDIDYKIRITQRKKKLQLEVGDVIVYYPHAYNKKHFPCFGFIKRITKIKYRSENWIVIKWFGEFPPNNYYSERELRYHQHIKIYKETNIEELNI